jgi:hypothetical protein
MVTTRRSFLKAAAAAAGLAAASPFLIGRGRDAFARTAAFGKARHLIYIRLRGGFRFTTAFNADVADSFNPFGLADGVASGAEWGVGRLLGATSFLDGEEGARRAALGMQSVPAIANRIAVVPCVDHEPTAAGADGNHGSGLDRYWYGGVDGPAGFFTYINHGLAARYAEITAAGEVAMPAFCLGDSGMARGLGVYAAHRPPVVQNGSFDGFGLSTEDAVPAWARDLSRRRDETLRDRLRGSARATVDAFVETRKATTRFAEIFSSPTLQTRSGSEPIDGLSHDELRLMFGDGDAGRNLRLALRLFHFGCPAVYLDQGGYDLHSGEENGLPGRLAELARLISALVAALTRMTHPAGGTYWDHTVVAIGSEFGRTARKGRFNSARGSDHNSDLETRWMSMPFFGGPVSRPGAMLGETRREDLVAEAEVVSYRSVLKSLLDVLGAEHEGIFTADRPFAPLFTG